MMRALRKGVMRRRQGPLQVGKGGCSHVAAKTSASSGDSGLCPGHRSCGSRSPAGQRQLEWLTRPLERISVAASPPRPFGMPVAATADSPSPNGTRKRGVREAAAAWLARRRPSGIADAPLRRAPGAGTPPCGGWHATRSRTPRCSACPRCRGIVASMPGPVIRGRLVQKKQPERRRAPA